MGLRFRRSLKIAPGVRLNFSKSGISTTVGPKGANVNIGKNGTYLNTGIPGTGIYSREKISGGSSSGSTENYDQEPVADNSLKNTGGRHLLLGVFTIGLIWFFLDSPMILLAGACFMLFRFISHATRKSKPVYEQRPVYKQDRRYKTGQRIDGYQSAKVGEEPLPENEIKQHKRISVFRAVYGLILFAIAVWQLMAT